MRVGTFLLLLVFPAILSASPFVNAVRLSDGCLTPVKALEDSSVKAIRFTSKKITKVQKDYLREAEKIARVLFDQFVKSEKSSWKANAVRSTALVGEYIYGARVIVFDDMEQYEGVEFLFGTFGGNKPFSTDPRLVQAEDFYHIGEGNTYVFCR